MKPAPGTVQSRAPCPIPADTAEVARGPGLGTPAWVRHADCGRALHEGLEKLGLALFVASEAHRLPELTTVRVPEGADDAAVRRALLDRFGIEIGGGVGALAGQVWRIGCMGHTARHRNVTLLLAALAEVLRG